MSRPARQLVAVAAAVVLLLTVTHPASAHVHLVGSSPAAGETLAQVPAEVVVGFDGPVELPPQGGLRVWVGEQEVAVTPALDDSGTQVRAALPEGVPGGTHRVAWRIVASDSHVEEGEFSYVVETPAEPSSAGAEPAAAETPSDEPAATVTDDAPVDAAPTDADLMADTAGVEADGSGGGSTVLLVVALLAAAAVAAVLLLRGGRTDADA